MYEKLNETKEFDELSENGKTEYLNSLQDSLEENDTADDLFGVNGTNASKKAVDTVKKAKESDVAKTVSDTISEFEQKFDAKTILDKNGNMFTEHKNKLGDAESENLSTYSDYTCDSYVITSGKCKGMTRPERLDISSSDVIENNRSIIGEPLEDMKEHKEQEMPNSCAVACNKYIIEALTGKEIDESELRNVAKDYGYTDATGTPFLYSGKIAEHYGLKSEFHSSISDKGLTLDNAVQRIENGEKIIAAVDTNMLYYPEVSVSPFSPFLMPKANHAVEIIGFDKSNPDDVKVIINDPGFSDGAGNIYSWDTFKKCSMDSFVSIHK